MISSHFSLTFGHYHRHCDSSVQDTQSPNHCDALLVARNQRHRQEKGKKRERGVEKKVIDRSIDRSLKVQRLMQMR